MAEQFVPINTCASAMKASLRAFEDVVVARKGHLLREGLADAAGPAEVLRGLSFALRQYCAVVIESPLGTPVSALLPSEGRTTVSKEENTTSGRFGAEPMVVRVVQMDEGADAGWAEVYRRGPTGPVGTVEGSAARTLLQQADL